MNYQDNYQNKTIIIIQINKGEKNEKDNNNNDINNTINRLSNDKSKQSNNIIWNIQTR